MDVNGTRFHHLLERDDWLIEQYMEWNNEPSSIILERLPFRFPRPPGDPLLTPEKRRGAGRDRYGNFYFIGESEKEIRFQASNARKSEHFWSIVDSTGTCQKESEPGTFKPERPLSISDVKLCGLAVTGQHYLAAGMIEPAGILIFDLYSGGPPVMVLWKTQFEPFDMAPSNDGGIWILDRTNKYLWKLDCRFNVVAKAQESTSQRVDDFLQESGEKRIHGSQTIPARLNIQAKEPVSVEEMPDGTVLILDGDPDITVYRYSSTRFLGSISLGKELEKFLDLRSKEFFGHDIAYLPDKKNGDRLYLVAADGNQVFAFDCNGLEKDFSIKLIPGYYPLRLFGGKGLIAAGEAIFYDMEDMWLQVVEQRRYRYMEKGTMKSRILDGKEIDCVWHRLFIDAFIPPGNGILVESRAANEKELLLQAPWQEEPQPYRRSYGSELPYHYTSHVSQEGMGTWELLFQRARGKYLELRLTFLGTGRSSPMLHAVRVYYPRFSYLKEYLPSLYQDDENSASFLGRFLGNMEGIYTEIEGRIENVQILFDTSTTLAEYLEWLAGWFGVILDPEWDENRKRLFLSHAMQLFGERGTMAGLIHMIRLWTDPCPDETLFEDNDCSEWKMSSCYQKKEIVRYSVRIVEQYLTRDTPSIVYGDPSEIEGPGVTTGISDWTPSLGTLPIHKSYRAYLEDRYQSIEKLNTSWHKDYESFDKILFSPVQPENPVIKDDWKRFIRNGLGFPYAAVTSRDKDAYIEFLAGRYKQVNLLNIAHKLNLGSFDEVILPGEDDFPSGEKSLFDWIQFVSLVLPIRQKAHLFTVLVPIYPGDDQAAQERQMDHVRHIVELEKPAHTNFEVKQYWALFRIGEARLGLDTKLDKGSRFVALVLGKGTLMDNFLAPSHPWDVPGRIVVGREKNQSI